jgi:hypothetical protein
MNKDEHYHNWHIFRDSALNNSGYLTFFCNGCLKLKKIKKEYD